MRRIALACFALLAIPSMVAGQARVCSLDAPGRTTQQVVGADTVVVLHDPFFVACDDGAELQADSGTVRRTIREFHLVGNVFFRDTVQSLTSDEATYSAETGRLHATGDVVFTNIAEGSKIEGPELEYYRATEERPESRVIAPRRPRLTLERRDEPGAAEDTEPLVLIADSVFIVGEDDLSAFGDVVITRSDMNATAEEARYNSSTEDLALRREAIITSEDYSLAGDSIDARMADGSIDRVHSRVDASIEGEDVRVEAPDLLLFFSEDLLQRAVATTPASSPEARARAISETFQLEADSLDAVFVDQQIDVVYAVGAARGESIDTTAIGPAIAGQTVPGDSAAAPGSLPPEDAIVEPDSLGALAEAAAPESLPTRALTTDWITGDTITGYFEPAAPDSLQGIAEPTPTPGELAPPDSLSTEAAPPPVELRRLVARGSAQSLYHIAPRDTIADAAARPNINFLVGDEIELVLNEGELQEANVKGLIRGVYLEAAEAAATPADGAQTPPDGNPAGPGTPLPGLTGGV